jgi:spore coat polysaccharide biosynthesis predicted glycosyltransferase SpsG
MRLVVMSEASPKIGAGHFMRTSAIIEESISRGIETWFAGSVVDMPWLENKLRGIESLELVTDLKTFVPNANDDVLLLDSYQIDPQDSFIQPNRWRAVVTLVDEFTPPYVSSLKIHPGLTASWLNGINVLHGPDFIPIRKKVQVNKNLDSESLRIVIVGGGTDLFDFGNVIARELSKIETNFKATVFTERPTDFLLDDARFQFERIGTALDQISHLANLILTTSSTTCLEFIADEKAIGVFCGIGNQQTYYKTITKLGLAAPLGQYGESGWEVDSVALNQIITNNNLRMKLKNATIGYIDGQGSARILDEIVKM